MSTHVLLHLNLLRTDDDVRETFYELMKTAHWQKSHPAFTAWSCTYNGDDVKVIAGDVIAEIKRLAAKAAVPKLYAVAQVGNTKSFDFEYLGSPRLVLNRY